MNTQRLGLDRDLRLEWLDEAASIATLGLSRVELQAALMAALEGELPGTGHNSARGKTVTVLKRVWSTVPVEAIPLRDRALRLLPDSSPSSRMAVHWAMLVVAYPFFADVTSTIGRLLQLQGTFERGQVVRRLGGKWGDRPTIPKAVRRVLLSLVGWGALSNKGSEFYGIKQPWAIGPEHAAALLESVVLAAPDRTAPLHTLIVSPMLFPFDVRNGLETVRVSGRFDLHREGADMEIVSLRG